MRKFKFFEDIKVAIVGNYVSGIGCKSTIYKFIIIGVNSDCVEFKMWINKLYVITFNNGPNDIFGNRWGRLF